MKRLLKKMLLATFGLLIFAFGVYLSIQACIGLAPWDVFAMGIANKLSMKYGDISVIVAFTIVVVDILLKEPIGFGMLLDAIVVGKAVDLYTWLNIVPAQTSFLPGLIVLLIGLAVEALAQWIYMSAGIGCGPRDALLVGLGKRMKKLPIGLVQFILLAAVLTAGWLLDGPVGLGTLIAVTCQGILTQLVFKIVHFEPRDIVHENIIESIRKVREA